MIVIKLIKKTIKDGRDHLPSFTKSHKKETVTNAYFTKPGPPSPGGRSQIKKSIRFSPPFFFHSFFSSQIIYQNIII